MASTLEFKRIKLTCSDSGTFWFDIAVNDCGHMKRDCGRYYVGFHKIADDHLSSRNTTYPVALDQESGAIVHNPELGPDEWKINLGDVVIDIGNMVTFKDGNGGEYKYKICDIGKTRGVHE